MRDAHSRPRDRVSLALINEHEEYKMVGHYLRRCLKEVVRITFDR